MLRWLAVLALVGLVVAAPASAAPKQCADRKDNDADGLIDLTDPGCASKQDNDEYNAPPVQIETVALVLINFSNDQSQPYTPARAAGIVLSDSYSANAFVKETSYGKASLSGDVFGWWTVPYSNDTCDTLAWTQSAEAMAQAQGVDLYSYDQRIWLFPHTSACQYTARAGIFVNGSANFTVPVIAHELGHSAYGLSHANYRECSLADVRVPLSDTCSDWEYGDSFDDMGNSQGHQFSGWERVLAGWLSNIRTVTTSGTYQLAPLHRTGGPPQLLVIPRSDGSRLLIEFRQSNGQFDADWPGNDEAVQGLMIRLGVDAPLKQTFILDATPENDGFWERTLPVGRSLIDPRSATVTLLSYTSDSAMVGVVF